MKIVDDSNWQQELVIGQNITGLKGGFGLTPPPPGTVSSLTGFGAVKTLIPRNEWPDRIKELKAKRMNVSAFQNWPCDNQGSFPTCWAAGTCQAMATLRVMMLGLKQWIRYSAMSLAVPISGGNSGGWEEEAWKYAREHGVVDSALWGYTDRSRKDSDPAVQANRAMHKGLDGYSLSGNHFDCVATASLLSLPTAVSYNWWSHVVMVCDLVEIERNSFGLLIRNNWGDSYGDKNEYGHGGYAVFREGKGTPSGGVVIQQMTASQK